VEILRDDRLEKCLFRIPDIVRRQATTENFREERKTLISKVKRDNNFSKISDFLSRSDDLVFELTSYPALKRLLLVLHADLFALSCADFTCLQVRKNKLLMDVTFFVAILLNVLNLFQDGSGVCSIKTDPNDALAISVFVFGLVLSLTSFLRLGSFYAANMPLIYHR
jgi:hypothetical protein